MIHPKPLFDLEDCLVSQPAKRVKLCDKPLSPFSPFTVDYPEEQSFEENPDSELLEVPFSIKWSQHPETTTAFPVPIDENKIHEPIIDHQRPKNDVNFPCVRRCICCPKAPHVPFTELLQSMPYVDTSIAEEMLQPFPYPFPELSLDAVMSILSTCSQQNSTIAPGSNEDNFRLHASSLTVEGPFNNQWYIGGILPSTSFSEIKSSVECLFSRCRRESDINARFSLITENRYRSFVGEQIKGRLWDVTPEKVAVDIFNQLAKLSPFLGEQLFVKVTIYLQEPTVKLLSDNDVKKKRSVITIYEKEDASLIYAFYVAVRRNIIVKQKKGTNDQKKKKELENQLTNVYRKGRKSLKKKTQSVLDKSKVLKSVDDVWNFSDIPLLEMKLQVRCVVFSECGKCLYEGGYEFQSNEIDLLFINKKFHVLASRNVFRNYNPALPSQS